MNLQEMKELIQAEVLSREFDETIEIASAYATDLMSDALAFTTDSFVLITGLINAQTIRTAEMKDCPCVVYSRGKKPDRSMIDLADNFDMCVMATDLSTFEVCGLLYGKGITGPNNHGQD